MNIDRRKVLALAMAGAGTQAVAQPAAPSAVRFAHGVASGDPSQTGVLLWTRLTPTGGEGPRDYSWRLWPADGKGAEARGTGRTGGERDYTAKVEVAGLAPGREYLFQFTCGAAKSPVGRTRTLPSGHVADAVLAVVSCTLYPNGHFNAYGAIAKLPRVDAVVHLGDYIYEYGGPGSYGMDSAVAGERPHDPPHECVTLDDYRRRHAQYKSDPQLQAAHARAPWIVVWDDHETANDSWRDGAENHQPATEGDWSARKAAALKAYFEWMPIREPGGEGLAIYRSFDFGDVASLFMLETRLTARDKQLTYKDDLPATPAASDLPVFRAKLEAPERRMMAPAQARWLGEQMAASVRAGRPWQILGNQVLMARITPPEVRRLMGEAAVERALAGQPPAIATRIAGYERTGALGLPWGLDMWDGYPADRQRLYEVIRQAGARTLVVSGDSHAFWANELYDAPDGGRLVAIELGTTGVTSPGAEDTLKTIPAGALLAQQNREVVFCDQAAKGFVLLSLTHGEAKGELIKVRTITEPSTDTTVLKTYRVAAQPGGAMSKLSEA